MFLGSNMQSTVQRHTSSFSVTPSIPRRRQASNASEQPPTDRLPSTGVSTLTNTPRNSRVAINISGTRYETYTTTLNKYPETLLGTHEKRRILYNKPERLIYIDRSRIAFEAILFYYQSSGRLVCPPSMCMGDFIEECYYYELPTKAIKCMTERDNFLFKRRKVIPPRYSDIRNFFWSFFDSPKSLRYNYATIYALFSYFLVLVSIGIFCVETELYLMFHNEELDYHISNLRNVELGLNIFFAVELLIRLIVNPWPKEFLKIPLNFIESISISLFLIFFASPEYYSKLWSFRLSRMLRVFRLARISKLSKLVKAAVSVVQTSLNEVVAVVFVILIVCIFLGSIMYFVEYREPDTDFTSIPNAMWWAVQTVLCVGYGDIIPTSLAGKIVGGTILYFGVLSITVMLLSLGGRIFDMYSKEITKKPFLPVEKEDYEIHY